MAPVREEKANEIQIPRVESEWSKPYEELEQQPKKQARLLTKMTRWPFEAGAVWARATSQIYKQMNITNKRFPAKTGAIVYGYTKKRCSCTMGVPQSPNAAGVRFRARPGGSLVLKGNHV